MIHPLKLTSALLGYPEPEFVDEVKSLDPGEIGPVRNRSRDLLSGFMDWFTTLPVRELQANYVQTFDFVKQRSLHLTYHQHGDSRQRGLALLKIKTVYRESGFNVTDVELPDYLPLMLEFAAMTPGDEGRDLLDTHRAGIELIRDSLNRQDSPYGGLLDVVCEDLPSLNSRQIKRIRKLAEEGPPTELVGLEPFAPPEVMPNGPGEVALPLVGGRG